MDSVAAARRQGITGRTLTFPEHQSFSMCACAMTKLTKKNNEVNKKTHKTRGRHW